MVKTLMMSAKVASPGLLKIEVFWNKVYYVIYSTYDVTKNCQVNQIILCIGSCDQSLVTPAFV